MTPAEARTLSQQIIEALKLDPREQWCVGYEEGYRRGYDVGHEVALRNIPQHLVEDKARELLTRDAEQMRRDAYRGALAARGPVWADLLMGGEAA